MYWIVDLNSIQKKSPGYYAEALVAGDGFEPTTFGLWAQRATPALSRNNVLIAMLSYYSFLCCANLSFV